MIELLNHPAYKIIHKYKNNGVVVDYVIMQNEVTKHTYEDHKKAAINAMKIIAERWNNYAYTFLEPPYGNKYVIKDWEVLNNVLFSSKEDLEIYQWSTNWSNYFNDGLEWWGAYYWTVYDLKYNIFVVIGASATD